MATTKENFEYPSLDPSTSQIRLICLEPQSGSNIISCSLKLADLDDNKCQFDALSYEWGDAAPIPRLIKLNDQDFPVRANLWWALWHLRTQTTRIIWIDALCINQQDGKEKNHQDQQMGRIYKSAQVVIAWIGLENRGHEIKPFQLQRSKKMVKVASRFLSALDNGINEEIAKFDLLRQLHKRLPHALQALSELFTRSYWRRLWIIQELVLASHITIQCGDTELSWQGFAVLNSTLLLIPDTEDVYKSYKKAYELFKDSSAHRIYEQKRVRKGVVDAGDILIDVFRRFIKAECVDLRDKAFGVLSLSRKCCQLAMPPEYSLSASDVCTAMIQHGFQHYSQRRFGSLSSELVRSALTTLKPEISVQPPFLLKNGSENGILAKIECRVQGHIDRVQFDTRESEGKNPRVGDVGSLPDLSAQILSSSQPGSEYSPSVTHSRNDHPKLPRLTSSESIRYHVRQLFGRSISSPNILPPKILTFHTDSGYSDQGDVDVQIGDLALEHSGIACRFLVIVRSENEKLRIMHISEMEGKAGLERVNRDGLYKSQTLFMDLEALHSCYDLLDWSLDSLRLPIF